MVSRIDGFHAFRIYVFSNPWVVGLFLYGFKIKWSIYFFIAANILVSVGHCNVMLYALNRAVLKIIIYSNAYVSWQEPIFGSGSRDVCEHCISERAGIENVFRRNIKSGPVFFEIIKQ